MKKIILATLGMGLLAMGLNANANPNTVGANVTETCDVAAAPTNTSLTNMGVSGSDLTLTDPAAASTATLTYGGSFCNYMPYVKVKSTNGTSALESADPMPAVMLGHLADEVPYTADVTFCGVNPTIAHGTATTNEDSVLCTAAPVGDVILNVVTTPGALPLFASTYSDIVTVELSPTP